LKEIYTLKVPSFHFEIELKEVHTMDSRGLKCSNHDGNQRANERYWQNNNLLLSANCMKLYTFLSVCIYSWQETASNKAWKPCFSYPLDTKHILSSEDDCQMYRKHFHRLSEDRHTLGNISNQSYHVGHCPNAFPPEY
jgi:hypothetical protein